MSEKNFVIVDNSSFHGVQQKTAVLMKDMVKGIFLPLTKDEPCHWCREPSHTMCYAVPLKYHKHRKSGIHAERMKEHFRLYNLPTDHKNDHFETEGIFCGRGCVKAVIEDELQKKPYFYRKSLGLLTIMGTKIDGSLSKVVSSPHWRLLKKWGGFLTIEDFRANSSLKRYEISPNTKRPYMYCTGRYVEERDI
uniref:Very late transcription factor n=1 Tax=Giant Blood Marseillevirus TaxID=1370064 RepID=U6A1Y9_9VIRU|nr:very late transcription factor [Giant Blood Marseillevirus]